MVHTVPWIRAHGSQIFQMNLAQSRLQFLRHTQVDTKRVGRKLIVSGKYGQDKTQHLVDGSPNGLKED